MNEKQEDFSLDDILKEFSPTKKKKIVGAIVMPEPMDRQTLDALLSDTPEPLVKESASPKSTLDEQDGVKVYSPKNNPTPRREKGKARYAVDDEDDGEEDEEPPQLSAPPPPVEKTKSMRAKAEAYRASDFINIEKELEPTEPDDFFIDEEEEQGPRPRLPYDLIGRVGGEDGDFPSAVRKCTGRITRFSLSLFLAIPLLIVFSIYSYLPSIGLPPIGFIGSIFEFLAPYGPLIHLVAQGFGIFLGMEIILSGLYRLVCLSPTSDTLIALQSLSVLAYNIVSLFSGDLTKPSYTALSLLFLTLALASKRQKLTALKRNYTAATLSTMPYGVHVVREGRSYIGVKNECTNETLCAHIAASTVGERLMCVVSPFFVIIPPVLAFLICKEDLSAFPWVYSALCTLGLPFGFISTPYTAQAKGLKKLFTSGTAYIDNGQIAKVSKIKSILLQDNDVFPPGSVEITGLKVIGNNSIETVLSYATALFESIGGGAYKAFYDISKTRYVPMRKASALQFYESGGMSAVINQDNILFGTGAFLTRMGVTLSQGLGNKENVFIAINSNISAVFTIQYNDLPQTYAAFRVLTHFNIRPILSTLNFQISPVVLADIFDLNPDFIVYPNVEDRIALADPQYGGQLAPVALLSRYSIQSFSQVIAFGKRVFSTAKFNIVCSVAAALSGLFLMNFLAANGEYSVASPYNLFLYLLLWNIPIMLKNSASGKF